MDKDQESSATETGWRKLHVPVPRPDPLHDTFAWTVGIGLVVLFLILVVYAYAVYHR